MHTNRPDGSPASVARILALTLSAVALVFGLVSCSTNHNSTTPSTSGTAASSGAQLDVGNTINYGSFGTTTDIDCGNGKSLNVGGSNNTLTVKGTCGSVSIGGADNKITLDKIDNQLHVVGFNNTITYKDGSPKVDNVGTNNTINKG
ncbi:MAG: DUF3060 domain-containing protein [Mycobacterium sp.]|nr:DUF3060 domain-containing protein [Mycobacterium sp.]